jgi:hypothetical protein
MQGFQGAGILNISAQDESSGFQGAGISNYAESFYGVQASGIVNVAGTKLQGAQLGLINFGREVRGAQIGLINIASKRLDGAAVGLINYAGNGILAPTLWSSDTSFVNIGLKMGGPYLYGIFNAGVHFPSGRERFSIGMGFGGHVDLYRLWLEIDTTVDKLMSGTNWETYDGIDQVIKFRPTLGFRVIDQLSIYVGPTLNLMITQDDSDEVIGDFYSARGTYSDYLYRMSIGYTVGIQWEPRFGDLNTH